MTIFKKFWDWIPWWGFAFLAAGWIFILAPVCTGGYIPGINGDSRFNLYILEHFYRWIAGMDRSLLDAQFFYPYPLTLGFSDPHTLTGFFYSALRFAGFKSTDALCAWFAAGNILNYITAYWVLRKFGLRDLGAGIGAFLYVFSLPCTAQFSHIQLAWRCAVPPALLCLQRYLDTRGPLMLGWTVLLVSLQAAMSFYLGLFLVLLIIGWTIGWMVWHMTNSPAHPLGLVRNSLPLMRNTREVILLVILLTASAIVLLWGVWPNLEASMIYGFRRGWGEIAAGLPRLSGYLQAFYSNIWWRDRSRIPDLPMWWEQNLFPGIIIIAACISSIIPQQWNRREIISHSKYAMLFLFILTLSLGGSALYLLLTKLPGFSAVRSVSRIVVIMMFPAAFVTGAWIESLVIDGRRMLTKTIGWLLITIVLAEASMILQARVSSGQWEARLSLIRNLVWQELHGSDMENRLLVVIQSKQDAEKWDAFERELDAMLLAQELGIRTLNGYSGNVPPGWKRMSTADDIVANIDMARKFRDAHGFPELPMRAEDFIVVGEGDVDGGRLAAGLKSMLPSSALPAGKN